MRQPPRTLPIHVRAKSNVQEYKDDIIKTLVALRVGIEEYPIREEEEYVRLLSKCINQVDNNDNIFITPAEVFEFFDREIAKVSCGKNVVIYFLETKEQVSYLSTAERFVQYKYIADINENGIITKPAFYYWYNNTSAYYDFIFDPTQENTKSFNLFRGFKYQEDNTKDCSLYLNHIRYNVCSNNYIYYNYLLDWMASIIQKPWEKIGVAIAITGLQGNGKTEFVNHFKELLYPYTITLKQYEDIDSRFNIDLIDKLLIHGDEVIWGGNKSLRGPLKKKITDYSMIVEAKGENRREVKTYTNLIFTSNERFIVPVEKGDRRYFILEMGNDRLNDLDYFVSIQKQMREGGYNKLMYILKNRNIKSNLRKIPISEIKKEGILEGLDWLEKWIYINLNEGFIQEDEKIYDGFFLKNKIERAQIWKAKEVYIPANKYGYDAQRTYKILREIFEPSESHSGSVRYFHFDKRLEDYRESFEKHIGFKITWEKKSDNINNQPSYKDLLQEIINLKGRINELEGEAEIYKTDIFNLQQKIRDLKHI